MHTRGQVQADGHIPRRQGQDGRIGVLVREDIAEGDIEDVQE